MSSSAITTQVSQLKAGNIQNQADSSSIYSSGQWSFKNSTAVASVTITDAGNVGVGATTTSAKLTIKNPSATGEQQIVNIQSAASTDAIAKVTFNQTTDVLNIANFTNTGALVFGTGGSGTERMRLDAAGSLKIAPNSIQGATTKGFSLRSISTDGGANSANTYCTARYGAGKFVVLAAFDPSGNSVAASTAVGAGSTFIVLVTDAASNY